MTAPVCTYVEPRPARRYRRPAVRCGLPAARFRAVRRRGTPTVQTVLLTATGAGSWTVPATVTSVTAHCIGGGGGTCGTSTGFNNSGERGAAGGAYARRTFAVTAGASIPYTVGAAGTAGSGAGVDGGPGGTSWFSSNNSSGCVATGGAQGTDSAAGTGSSSGCYGDQVYAGGSGGPLNGTDQGGSGGGAAGENGAGAAGSGTTGGAGNGTYSGKGGNAVTGSTGGNAGSSYGGGASGPSLRSWSSSMAGFAGAQGVIVLVYTEYV